MKALIVEVLGQDGESLGGAARILSTEVITQLLEPESDSLFRSALLVFRWDWQEAADHVKTKVLPGTETGQLVCRVQEIT